MAVDEKQLQGDLQTHLAHIHRREPCDDCGPAIDFALESATEVGGQVGRLRNWLAARRPDEFDLTIDGTVVTAVLTLLDRQGREWPDANQCRSIEVALREHASDLRREAKKIRDLGHPVVATNLEIEADGILEQLVPQFSSQLDLPLEPAGVAEPGQTDGPSLFDDETDSDKKEPE